MLKDALHTSEGLNHISSVVVQVPQLAIVLLVGPPEGVLLQNLVLFEVLPHSPAFIIGQGQSVFLEKGVYPWNTSVPAVFKVI
jgi:hypothetical protein